MHDTTRLALVGTANLANDAAGLAALEPQLLDYSRERRLLLQAGSLAVYRQAGGLATPLAAGGLAPADTLPEAPASANSPLADIIAGTHTALAPWAAARLLQAGYRLPARLLPLALATAERRQLWFGVAGQRGQWLASQHPDWSAPDATPRALDDTQLETLWQEGRPAERRQALALLRQRNADQARQWLQAALPQEKAEQRCHFLEVLKDGLSAADEPLLQSLLDDRSQNVRQLVVDLLVQIPGSALSGLWQQRASQCLQWPVSSAGRQVAANPPTELLKEWEREGILATPPHGTGPRAWWLQQIVALVAPACWSQQTGASAGELLALLPQSDWADSLYLGLADAACRFADSEWAAALVAAHHAGRGVLYPRSSALWAVLSASQSGTAVLAALQAGLWQEAERGLASLTASWSDVLCAALTQLPTGSELRPDQRHDLQSLLELAVLRGPDHWLEPFTLAVRSHIQAPGLQNDWNLHYANRRAETTLALAAARQTLIKEIPL
ncbi:DUF5691 domain-containing protein [Parachitinimonas caeni]|uniref:DUF5691 domain-containing protein n=1 Tax=Parachitinimonas caeni TaxID=3031301 RepID=A0ABT7DYP0_9NEIS|nr:DUF5691 domain-containing protein [Parachitinimonas caeni]MDK2125182.1 DUF5691 domain-containing protein [Parachitinimonas caeni]